MLDLMVASSGVEGFFSGFFHESTTLATTAFGKPLIMILYAVIGGVFGWIFSYGIWFTIRWILKEFGINSDSAREGLTKMIDTTVRWILKGFDVNSDSSGEGSNKMIDTSIDINAIATRLLSGRRAYILCCMFILIGMILFFKIKLIGAFLGSAFFWLIAFFIAWMAQMPLGFLNRDQQ